MKNALLAIWVVVLAASAVSCGASSSSGGGSPAGPVAPAAPSQTAGFAGVWSGMSTDSQGDTIVNWTLAQNGSGVAGTVTTRAVDPADGSCNSCHRNKSGTMSGTISGSTLTMRMFFAAGVDGDPTPECSATLTGTASTIEADRLTGTYTGADTCEGPFMNGTLGMGRRP